MMATVQQYCENDQGRKQWKLNMRQIRLAMKWRKRLLGDSMKVIKMQKDNIIIKLRANNLAEEEEIESLVYELLKTGWNFVPDVRKQLC